MAFQIVMNAAKENSRINDSIVSTLKCENNYLTAAVDWRTVFGTSRYWIHFTKSVLISNNKPMTYTCIQSIQLNRIKSCICIRGWQNRKNYARPKIYIAFMPFRLEISWKWFSLELPWKRLVKIILAIYHLYNSVDVYT